MAEKDKGKGPIADGESFSTDEDVALTIQASVLLDGDVPRNKHNVLAVTGVGRAEHGTVSLVQGVVRYTPDADYNGLDGFTYVVADDKGETGIGAVSIVVRPVSDLRSFNAVDGANGSVHDFLEPGRPDFGTAGGPGNDLYMINPFVGWWVVSEGIAEFNVGNTGTPIVSAKLVTDLQDHYYNLTSALTINVYAYAGDGQVTVSDYGKGVLVGTATVSDGDTLNSEYTLILDAAAVDAVLDAGTTWLGLNIRIVGAPSGDSGLAFIPTATHLDLVW